MNIRGYIAALISPTSDSAELARLRERHDRLRFACDDWRESAETYHDRLGHAEERIKHMEVYRSPNGIEELALRTAIKIEDEFARGWPGGCTQRRAVVQIRVREALEAILLGSR